MRQSVLPLVEDTDDRGPDFRVFIENNMAFEGKAEQPFRQFIPLASEPGLVGEFR